ncbi:MAG: hypothetical protein RL268_47 [Pseudomonadota bacterium]|jgi:hypothetical protein
MAKLYITEFSALPIDLNLATPQLAKLPGLVDQVVTYSTSTQSAAFAEKTRFIRVHTDSDCHIQAGSDPVASGGHVKLIAGQTEYFGVTPGDKLAVVLSA